MEKLWFAIFNVVLAVAVFSSIFYYITVKSGPDDPDFYVRDITLSINEMSSKIGHVKVFYNLPAKYDIELKNCNVILKAGIVDKKYPYICDAKTEIIVSKKENVIILEKNEK